MCAGHGHVIKNVFEFVDKRGSNFGSSKVVFGGMWRGKINISHNFEFLCHSLGFYLITFCHNCNLSHSFVS